MVWLGSSKLPGTWNASQPPGATRSTRQRQQLEVAGDPLEGGVGDEDVDLRVRGRPGAQVADLEPQPRPGAARATISALESRPRTSASGQRRASRAVRLPGPQPRSTTDARGARADAGEEVHERAASARRRRRDSGRGPRCAWSAPSVYLDVKITPWSSRVVLMSRFLTRSATLGPCVTRWTTWSRRGRASAATSTWLPWRCSAGSPGWPATSTSPAARRSAPTTSSRGSSTCWPRCDVPGRRTSCRRDGCCARPW